MENNTIKKLMENKTLKAIGIVFLVFLIWNLFIYISIAFVKMELNPSMWSQGLRFAMIYFNCGIFLPFAPLMVNELKNK